MAGLLDYLHWRGDLSFDAAPCCEVDSAILARLSYFPFDLLALTGDSVLSIGEAARALLSVPAIGERVLLQEDLLLLRALAESARFGPLSLLRYRNTFDTENETQFCVVTVRLTDELACVSYRGTDNTLVGWKENFNMSFASPVPAQRLAVAYFRELTEAVPGAFLLTGHSKGGNLAVYAGAFGGEAAQARVRAVYNFDGPGFDARLMGDPGYGRICPRVRTMIPQSSVVGMLLEHEEEYIVVHSSQSGLMQHDIYSWDVERDHFRHLEKVTDKSRFLDTTVKDWIAGMDYARREAFVDALYAVLRDTNVRTLREMNKNRLASAQAMLKSLAGMDEATRRMLATTLLSLMRCAGEELTLWAREELENR